MIRDEASTREAAHDLEAAIARAVEQLPGVITAAVWLSEPNRLRSLHITAAPGAAPKIIVHAVAKILRRHGIGFDIGMVRVGPRNEGDAGPAPVVAPAHWAGRFLMLNDLTIERAGSRITCRVSLRREADSFDGEAVELDTEAGRVRAAARATLVAAEQAGDQLALGLEGTMLIDLFGRRYVAASIEAAVDRRFAVLAGIVPIDPARSPEEAACLAALRAIDRWIAW